VFLESVTSSEWQCSSKVSLPPNGTSATRPIWLWFVRIEAL
jgi:hypothetical protein